MTIQIVIDKKLLLATDRLVRRAKTSRSALVRDALRQYIRHQKIQALEDRDRKGYLAVPQTSDQSGGWEG